MMQQKNYKSKQIRALLEQNKELLLNGDSNNGICYDGIVDEDVYYSQKHRLMYLLKETNGNNSDGTVPEHYEDWNYVGWIKECQSAGDETLYSTLRNVAMCAAVFYDVIERGCADESRYFENGALRVDEALRASLRRIAVVNLKKTFGGGATRWSELNAYLKTDICDILREEMRIAEPTVVLCGGQQVFDFARMIYGLKSEVSHITTPLGNEVAYFCAGHTVYVNFYHPACRKSRKNLFAYAEDVFQTIKAL